jgi:hypothetical protein
MGDAQDARRSPPVSTPEQQAAGLERALQESASKPAPTAAPSVRDLDAVLGSPRDRVVVESREAVARNRRDQ